MKSSSTLLHLGRTVFALLAITAATLGLFAQDDASRVKFSDQTKPGLLKLSLPWADIKIVGTDGNEVVVTSSLQKKMGQGEVDKDGFRRLDDEVTFELSEKNNVVTLSIAGEKPWATQGTDFAIQVPRNTHLAISTQMGGDISIQEIDGDIDVNGMNGEVSLTNIGSSAVVNTMNGEVAVSFRAAPTKPVSITSMNGEIDVRLPSDTKANLKMRTHNGSIRTNFSEEMLTTKVEKTGRTYNRHATEAQEVALAVREAMQVAREVVREVAREVANEASRLAEDSDLESDRDAKEEMVPRAPRAPRAPRVPRMPDAAFGGKSITGTLNGGGVDISLSSMNGSITLRKAK